MVRLRVLYTKHVKRKHKVWQDGEVRQKSTGEARLLSERGEVIGTSKAPKCGFQANAEGLTCFDGYIVNCEEDLDAAAVPEHVVPAKRSALPNAMSQTVQVPNISRRAFRCPKLQLAPSLYSSGPRRKRPSVEDHVPDQDKQSPVPKKQRTDDQILALLQGGPPSQTPSISQPDAAKFLWFPLTETLQRTVTVSDGFDSAKQYQMSFAAALREEINLRLAELARAFAATVLRIKDLDAEKAREDQMRAFGVPYYTRCTLQLNRKGRPGQPIKDYLVIQCSKEKSSAYSKDGLWLISTHPTFHVGTRSPWLQNAVVRSCWHGPNQDGRFQIEFLSRKPDVLRHGAQVSPVCLIHGPFGCGKSTLLAAMIQLFAESKAIAGTQMRVLLAAHTNRAVDNVLSRLLNLGFT
ncbi:hypothetical protein WJX84_005652, partial [Apatococcus fuscideae]